MKARVLFGVGGFAFVLLALYVLPPVVLHAALIVLSLLAVYEIMVPTKLVRSRTLQAFTLLLALVQAVCADLMGTEMTTLLAMRAVRVITLTAVLASLVILLREHTIISFQDVAVALFAGLVMPYLLMSLIRIFLMDGGKFLVLLPLVAAWGSDTCALFAGMAFGKHKLAPVISPKKTVEGAVGGVAGATLLLLLVAYLFRYFGVAVVPYHAAALLGAAGAVIGQVGDLAFSIIKRQTGIKDYGHIFPGHGGVLDRFDSVIFVAPVVELILNSFSGV